MKAITSTDFSFPQQSGKYVGKVRDVYSIGEDLLLMVATDRISAFDVVLPEGIPYKGQILNTIAASSLDAVSDIIPNWKLSVPHPMVTLGRRCEPFKIEMVVRGYLVGHAWREYKAGNRLLCGVRMPDGMLQNQKFPEPIITPTTKAAAGHDEDISAGEIISHGLATKDQWDQLCDYTLRLFERGSQIAAQRGLILVDTKYEFGLCDGKITLMDEIHTPDSSRYFYAEGYEDLLSAGLPQRQLSKEFVREWLMESGFQGRTGETVPQMTPAVVESITARYVELYEKISGKTFEPCRYSTEDIFESVCEALKAL